MPDASVYFRQGEKRPVYGSASAASGTLQIQGAPTATLLDPDGEPVTDFEELAVTGYDQDAAATVRAWLLLESANLSGGYTLVFTFQAQGSDDITRTYRPSALVWVGEPHE